MKLVYYIFLASTLSFILCNTNFLPTPLMIYIFFFVGTLFFVIANSNIKILLEIEHSSFDKINLFELSKVFLYNMRYTLLKYYIFTILSFLLAFFITKNDVLLSIYIDDKSINFYSYILRLVFSFIFCGMVYFIANHFIILKNIKKMFFLTNTNDK